MIFTIAQGPKLIQVFHIHVTQFTPKLGLHTTGIASNVTNTGHTGEAVSNSRPPDGLGNSGSTSQDLAALDKLITYLLGQPNGGSTGNLDSWRRSRRASARGYRQLRSNAAAAAAAERGEVGGNVNTTPL